MGSRMTIPTWFMMLVISGLGLPAIVAQDDMSAKVDPLIAELGKEDAAANQHTIDALVKLGPESLDALEVAFAKASADVQKKIHRVREKIERLEGEKKVQGSVVTLDGEMSLDEVLDSLEDQSKTAFAVQEITVSKLELSSSKVSFWEAVDEVMDQAKLQVSPYGGENGQLSLIPRPPGFKDYRGRTAYSGAFRIAVTRIETSRDYTNPDNDGTNIKLEINWESHVKPIAIEQSLTAVKVIDEFKDPIPVRLPGGDAPAVISETVQPEIPVTEMYIPLELIDRKIEKIDRLDGTMNVLLPGRIETFDFGKLATVKPKHQIRKSHAVVTYYGSEKNDDLFTLTIGLEFDEDANPFTLHRGWVLENEMYLLDADGNKHEALGVEQAMTKENQMGLTFLFEDDPKKYKLVYKTPAQLIKIPVKYRLLDIILP